MNVCIPKKTHHTPTTFGFAMFWYGWRISSPSCAPCTMTSACGSARPRLLASGLLVSLQASLPELSHRNLEIDPAHSLSLSLLEALSELLLLPLLLLWLRGRALEPLFSPFSLRFSCFLSFSLSLPLALSFFPLSFSLFFWRASSVFSSACAWLSAAAACSRVPAASPPGRPALFLPSLSLGPMLSSEMGNNGRDWIASSLAFRAAIALAAAAPRSGGKSGTCAMASAEGSSAGVAASAEARLDWGGGPLTGELPLLLGQSTRSSRTAAPR
mmetsp:Transcript_69239/g.214925  ORF Transcript_69239/g.214925 Transcript_69239/m.214925 type:complete len:271 (+) Transcript_69239:117-929(+)